MSKSKIIMVLVVLILAVGVIFLKPVKKIQHVSKRPENFTNGVWIKKYPGGYACFKFETPDGIKIVCDPYNMDETVSADIVTESHQDVDHKDTSMLTGQFTLLKEPGEYVVKGIHITGIPGKHNKPDTGMTNTVFVFEINGIKIAHFASQGKVPSEEMWVLLKAFNGIDILLIQTFKSPHWEWDDIKMTPKECYTVIDRLNPKIVIPEHGTKEISKDFANHYHTQVEYINYDGFVVTKDILKNIRRHKILEMDNNGPTN